MRHIPVDQLKSGMITCKPIVTKRGQVIAKSGTVLTSQLIARLAFYKIEIVDVSDDGTPSDEPAPAPAPKPQPAPQPIPQPVPQPMPAPAPAPQPAPAPAPAPQPEPQPRVKEEIPSWIKESETHSQQVRKSPQFKIFQVDYSVVLNTLKEDFVEYIDCTKSIDVDSLYDDLQVLYHNKTTIEMFDMIHNIRQLDDSTYAHSLNVALVSRIIGKWVKLSKEDLKVLTVSGLLHDIGKTQIPDEILNKPGKPTDEEFALIKKHPKIGYDILKKHQVDPRIRKVALMHHERADGSGYPMELDGEEIDEFAAIVAIADVYDAMTAARSYRQPLCPFEVIAAFEKDGLQKYNPGFILTFLERVAATYQNNRVILNDGRGANIVLLNKRHISKPMVQLDDGSCIDLDREPDLCIKSIL